MSLIAIGLLALPQLAHAQFPGSNGKIAFESNRDGNNEIYVMNSDGTGQTRLTTNAGDLDADPAWSPDGTKIVFVSSRDGNLEIYKMNPDGTGQTRITNHPSADTQPSFSPDGSQIVFRSNRGYPFNNNYFLANGTDAIWIMSADGSGSVPECCNDFDAGFGIAEKAPDWSPDGGSIALSTTGSFTGQDCEPQAWFTTVQGLYYVNCPTTGLEYEVNKYDATFSPDGTLFAFTRANSCYGQGGLPQDNCSTSQIATARVDGTGEALLTSLGANGGASWQPLHPPGSVNAKKIDVNLAPVFRQCGAGANTPNSTHGAPDFPGGANPDQSCVPAALTGTARVGPLSVGSVQLEELPASDIAVKADITDVTTAAGADYNPAAGADLTLVEKIRWTDSYNGASGTDRGTVTDFDFSTPIDCATTSSTVIGSHCSVNTTANAVIPGMVKSGKAAVLNIFRIRINDSGPDNIRGNTDDKLFLQQGLFTP